MAKIIISFVLLATIGNSAFGQLPRLVEFISPIDPQHYPIGNTIAYVFFEDLMVTSIRDKEGRIIDCVSANIRKTPDGLVEVAWLNGSKDKMAGKLSKTDSGVRYTIVRHSDAIQVGWDLNMRRRQVPEQDIMLIIRSLNSGRLITALSTKVEQNDPRLLQQQIDYERIKRLQNKLETERIRTSIENINEWLSLP